MRHKPVAKLSRRLGIPLTPKAGRVMEKRPTLQTGQRGSRRPGSPYKERLIEKQRLRFQYNISEKQMQSAFKNALASDEPTGFALVEDLETRLDAVVLRAGFARTIYQARQYVSHGHVHIDGKRVDRAAYRVQVGQTVSIAPKSRELEPFTRVIEFPEIETPPTYLEVTLASLTAKLAARPSRPLIPIICNEQLVVEYYAR